jgi:hypothetical protein
VELPLPRRRLRRKRPKNLDLMMYVYELLIFHKDMGMGLFD